MVKKYLRKTIKSKSGTQRLFLDLKSWHIIMQPYISRLPYTLILVIFFEVFLIIFALLVLWKPDRTSIIISIRKRVGFGKYILVCCFSLFPLVILHKDPHRIFNGFYTHLSLFLFFSLFSVVLTSTKKILSWKGVFSGLILFYTIVALANGLFKASDYPFSLSWSEGNRIWEYSTYYASHLYNLPFDNRIKTLTDVGRTSLWGLPFLIPNVSIQIVRIWDVL